LKYNIFKDCGIEKGCIERKVYIRMYMEKIQDLKENIWFSSKMEE
jgi:hypothetical protein